MSSEFSGIHYVTLDYEKPILPTKNDLGFSYDYGHRVYPTRVCVIVLKKNQVLRTLVDIHRKIPKPIPEVRYT